MTRTSPPSLPLSGGCACGAVRFTATAPPTEVAWCHCRTCQRSVGAPAVAWASFPAGTVTWRGPLATWRSSDRAQRGFCGACGSSLAWLPDRAGMGPDLAVATFDAPEALAPTFSIWCGDRLPCTEGLDAHLPRSVDAGPDPA